MTIPAIKVNCRYTLPARNSLQETVHVFDDRTRNAVEAAWTSGRPLLVRGDPGAGKSQLARAVARATEWQFISEVINAHTEIQDLWYHFDAVGRLGQAQILSAITSPESLLAGKIPEALNPEKFLSPGILWWAYDWHTARDYYKSSHYPHYHPDPECDPDKLPAGIVLLIDEIDKAGADLPNSLLETLDMGRFRIPWINRTVGCHKEDNTAVRPLVIITTNEDRQLPPAFVRRCLALHLELPKKREDLVHYLIERGKQHFINEHEEPFFDDKVMAEAAGELFKDRQRAKELGVMPPGQAEYLDMLRVLSGLSSDTDEQLEKLRQIKNFVLRKHPGMKQDERSEESRPGDQER